MKRDRFTAILLAIAIMAAGGVARASISTPHVVSQKAAPVSVEVHCVADTAEISANTYDSAAYDDDPIFCTFLVNITEKRASIFAVWGPYILTEEELLEVMYRAGTDPAGYVDGQNLYAYYPGPNGVDPLGLWGIHIGRLKLGNDRPWLVFNRKVTETFASSTAGVGDAMTLGGSKWVRGKLGTDYVWDEKAYSFGKTSGRIALVSGGSALALQAAAVHGTLGATAAFSAKTTVVGMGVGGLAGGGVAAWQGGDAKDIA